MQVHSQLVLSLNDGPVLLKHASSIREFLLEDGLSILLDLCEKSNLLVQIVDLAGLDSVQVRQLLNLVLAVLLLSLVLAKHAKQVVNRLIARVLQVPHNLFG